jgi:hypothetical protein
MSSFERCELGPREPVELLLRRLVDHALLGSLVTSAVLGGACADDPERARTTDPITGVDSGGTLIPEPIPRRDAGGDARAVMEAAAPEASVDAEVEAAVDAGADTGPRSEVPSDAFDPCLRGAGFPVRADGLNLTAPADYVGVRTAAGIQGAPGEVETWDNDGFTLVSERGTPCATATSPACAQKVARHPDMLEQSYCVQACVEWSLVTTRGDAVERWATPPELLQLLGSIDSDDDALMLAASRGFDVTCPAPGESSSGANLRYVRTTFEGRELVGMRYASTCPVVLERVRLVVTPAGDVRELDSVSFAMPGAACVGRVPAGLEAISARSGLEGYLARCAHLEAASVYAFERLAHELRAHGAPAALVERALRAADDEVRHAHVMAQLTRERGGSVQPARVQALPVRTLAQIARENAVEGCVRETYGAVVGAWQAARARDLSLRTAMAPIAADEARHAQLSHDVHAWLMTQLSATEQAAVRAAQHAAVQELFADVPPTLPEAGLPTLAESHALLTALDHTLWAA